MRTRQRPLTAITTVAFGLLAAVWPGVALAAGSTSITALGTTAASSTTPTLVLATPTGTASGDVMVARIAVRDDIDVTISAPTGWVSERSTVSGTALHTWVFVKVATAAEPVSQQFSFARAAVSAGSVTTFRGVDRTNPVESSTGIGTSSSAKLHPGGGIGTLGDRGLIVWFATQTVEGQPCAAPFTAPDGFAEGPQTCLPAAGPTLALAVASSPAGDAGFHSPAVGFSTIDTYSVTEELGLRAADAPPVAAYAAEPVIVGNLWDGYSGGLPFTDIPAGVLYEPSGLAASRTNPGVLYVHSEKDRRTMVAVSSANAKVLGRYSVTIPSVYDWEDIAVGPCPAGSCVFAGDIGGYRADLAKPTNVYSVVRVKEPDLGAGATGGSLSGEQFRFVYPGGMKKDAEALMVHPVTGVAYVITKTPSGTSEVFRFPTANPSTTSVTTLVKVTNLTLPLIGGSTSSVYVTAAAFHPTRNTFAVRTYTSVYEFRGVFGGSPDSAFAAAPVAVTNTHEGQGEALDYSIDGKSYFTLSEATHPPYTLKRVDTVAVASDPLLGGQTRSGTNGPTSKPRTRSGPNCCTSRTRNASPTQPSR